MKSLARKVFRSLGFTAVYRIFLRPESALKQLGWMESVRQDASVDARHQPIPWMTYPIVRFLDSRLKKTLTVFEYGSGNSTRWLADRVEKVVSLEHDKTWFAKVSGTLPPNVSIHLQEVEDDRDYGAMSFGDGTERNAYTQFISGQEERFDVILVDGVHRLSCLVVCPEALRPTGVLVVDNTNEPVFSEMRARLMEKGFREIAFHGMAPIQNWLSCSSVFYRRENCLEI